MIFLNILIFVFVLGFIVFVHEFCHFIAAKKAKAKIEEFCIGFPPRIFKKKKKGTLYSIGVIPWGGFVKIKGEDPTEEREKGSFYALNFWQRFWIILSGVISNFLLAILLFTLTFSLGYPQAIETENEAKLAKNVSIQIVFVQKNSPAEKAGILMGDKILKMKYQEKEVIPREVEDVQNFVKEYAGKKIIFEIERNKNEKKSIEVVPRKKVSPGEGPTGIVLAKVGTIKYSPPRAFLLSFKVSFEYTKTTFWAIGRIIKDTISGTKTPGVELTGPVGAGNIFSRVANLGFVYIVYFAGILSLSLGIFNSLPFPALDGGRFLFLIIEKIKNSPINPKVEKLLNEIGFTLLIILAIFITIKDIIRIF